MAMSDPLTLPPDAVAIRRLRVRGSGTDRAALEQRLRRSLARAPWPTPEDGAWVMLRGLRLPVVGADGVGPAAARLVSERLAAAVPIGRPDAADADAVRARDLTELLAHLALDLARGHAAGRWYWRVWAALFGLPVGDAIARLLGAVPVRLTGVTERLAALGGLGVVWRALTPAAGMHLLERLAVEFRLRLSVVSSASAAWISPLPARLLDRWLPALAGMAPDDPRVRLAAMLVILEARPLWLTGAAGDPALAGRFAAVAGALLAQPAAAFPIPAASPQDRGATAEPPALPAAAPAQPTGGQGRALDPAGAPVAGPGPPGAGPSPPTWTDPQGSGPKPADRTDERGWTPGSGAATAARSAPGPAPALRTDAAVPNAPAPDASGNQVWAPPAAGASDPVVAGVRVRPAHAPPFAEGRARQAAAPGSPSRVDGPRPSPRSMVPEADWTLRTAQGGLFYLVNFLARPEAAALRRAHGPLIGHGADGWHWLWGLGLGLGLDPDGPLAAYLLEHAGDPPPSIVGLSALVDALADLGARLYGAGDGPDELWRPDLLAVPTLLRATPSHLDLVMPLGSARVAVRRVALDVNPGWVPWLGRVVTFHYQDPWPGTAG